MPCASAICIGSAIIFCTTSPKAFWMPNSSFADDSRSAVCFSNICGASAAARRATSARASAITLGSMVWGDAGVESMSAPVRESPTIARIELRRAAKWKLNRLQLFRRHRCGIEPVSIARQIECAMLCEQAAE